MRSRFPDFMMDILGWLIVALVGVWVLAGLARGAQWCWEKLVAWWH